jgi:uncharacterized protein (DUF433 family)
MDSLTQFETRECSVPHVTVFLRILSYFYAIITSTMATKQQNYQDRIVSIPGVVGGKPVVKGTRIPVELVLKYLAADPDINHLFEAYPHLTREDVQACLAFAQEVIEEEEFFPLATEQKPRTHANV